MHNKCRYNIHTSQSNVPTTAVGSDKPILPYRMPSLEQLQLAPLVAVHRFRLVRQEH